MEHQSFAFTPPITPPQTWSAYFISTIVIFPPIWSVERADVDFVQVNGRKMMVGFSLLVRYNKVTSKLNLNPYLKLNDVNLMIKSIENGDPFSFIFENEDYFFYTKSQNLIVRCVRCPSNNCSNHHLIAKTESLIEALKTYVKLRQEGPDIGY